MDTFVINVIMMKSGFKNFTRIIITLLILNINQVNGQILKDSAAFHLIENCVDEIYNLRFDKAREICNAINGKYPGHPGVYLLNGMIKYWDNYPMLAGSLAIKSYLADMHNCIRFCEKKLNAGHEAEYLLINLCARGMLLMFYSDNDFSSEVLPLATSTYPFIRQSFNYTSVYYDFNFFTGLYNYYREAYPEAYPVYKAFAFLFPRGDMVKGIKELQLASNNALVLKAESYSFLSWISTNFEHDFSLATSYSKMLYELYPENTQYLSSYIKNLLLIKNYDEAEKLMCHHVQENQNSFFHAKFEIYKGILQEKKYRNNDLAFRLYEKGVRDISPFQNYGNEYAAYAYYGLSRISDLKGDKNKKKIYQKKANELSVFKDVDFND